LSSTAASWTRRRRKLLRPWIPRGTGSDELVPASDGRGASGPGRSVMTLANRYAVGKGASDGRLTQQGNRPQQQQELIV